VNEKAIIAAMEPLLNEVVELGKRIDDLARQPGPAGEKGEPGKDAEAPSIEALARAIVEDFADQLRGAPGEDGAAAPAPDLPELAKYLAATHADMLRPDPPSAVDVAISMYEKFADSLRGVKGDPGTDGKDGRDGQDGLDRPVMAVVDAQKQLERGAIAHYAGGLWQTTKKTVGDPSEDPQAYRIVCNGLSEVSHEFDPNERAHTIRCRLSDGQQFDVSWGDGPRLRVDGDGLKAIANDYRVCNSMVETHDGEKWKPATSLKGEPGEDGRRGRKGQKGDPGVGLKSLGFEQGAFHVELTAPIEVPGDIDGTELAPGVTVLTGAKDDEGRVSHFALSIQPPGEKAPRGAIRRFAGEHTERKRYRQGDLVAGKDGVYLALQNTQQALSGETAWQPIFKVPATPAPATGYLLQRQRRLDGEPREPTLTPEPGMCVARAGSLWFAEPTDDGLCWVEERA
jgi:hypothetical protein